MLRPPPGGGGRRLLRRPPAAAPRAPPAPPAAAPLAPPDACAALGIGIAAGEVRDPRRVPRHPPPSGNGEPPFEEQSDRHRVDPMLFLKYPRRQRLFRVVLVHRARRLHDDRSRVDSP